MSGPSAHESHSCSALSDKTVVVQSLSRVRLPVTPWAAAHQASLSFTISQNLFRFMFIDSVVPSNPLTLCHPLLLLPSIFPSVRVFSNELALHIRWPTHWSFSFSENLSFVWALSKLPLEEGRALEICSCSLKCLNILTSFNYGCVSILLASMSAG